MMVQRVGQGATGGPRGGPGGGPMGGSWGAMGRPPEKAKDFKGTLRRLLAYLAPHRLPLQFFDARTHGEILSRMTNDVDNIATTLQQSLTQLITSVATILGVVVMMLSISPLLTLVAVVTLPLYVVVTTLVAKRSQRY